MSDISGIFLCLFLLFILPMAGCMMNESHTDSKFYSISKDKWECTKMTYPKQEANEMFAPYCSQYTVKAGE